MGTMRHAAVLGDHESETGPSLAMADTSHALEEGVAALPGDVNDLELLEFLAGDVEPVKADPVFERELGRALWEIYRSDRASRVGLE